MMFNWKSVFFVFLLIAAIGAYRLAYKEKNKSNEHWLQVSFKESNIKKSLELSHDYNEFWEERPDGIGLLKMDVKLVPSIEDQNFYIIGYKAEVQLNSKALKLEKIEPNSIYTSEEFEISFWFSLLDEDDFRLESIDTELDNLSYSYTDSFFDLEPNGSIKVEQALITSKKIPDYLAKRIKKVKVKPFLRRNEQ